MTREEIAGYKVDKSTWGDGPWQTEPDRVDWVHAGLPCLALRHPRHGCWCGYAAVPPGHPLHGVAFGDLPEGIQAHNGLSYSGACRDDICHVPAAGEPGDVWWFGFDTMSLRDLLPGMEARERAAGLASHNDDPRLPGWLRGVYRALPYVRRQTERLAEQLAAYDHP